MNTITNSRLRSIIVENFPSLSDAGGFDYLRCIPNTKPFSELAQTNPHVLQERAQKGKVFIRPVQRDLVVQSSKKPRVSFGR